MTQLTQVAVTARKIIRYGIYFIVFLMVGKILLDISIAVYNKLFPAPPPAPTVKFGKLSKIPFPNQGSNLKINYVIETPDGGLPQVSDQAKVYFMPKINPNLLSLDVAKVKAKGLGFLNTPEQVNDTIYKFPHQEYPSTLVINIVTGVFSVSYDLNADRTPLDNRPPVAEVAASLVRSYLSNANVLPGDLTAPTTNSFLKLSDGKFIEVVSLSEGDVIKVNFHRKDYDDLPSITANPNQSNVWFIVSGAQNRNQQIIAGEYHYYPVDETEFSTYPIKTPEAAFSELQSDNAFFSSLQNVKDGETLKIRRVYLAYFDPEDASEFYQPVYVFEGDKNFQAIVPAVTTDYYGD